MFSKESLFRLSSVALLALFFISAKAAADKVEKPTQKTVGIFANISLVDEANMINNGAFHPSRLTTVDDNNSSSAEAAIGIPASK